MHFIPTPLQGAFIIRPQTLRDERGFFERTWCQAEFTNEGLSPVMVQASLAFNYRKGTLRGMHFQNAPYSEAKLVRCTRGSIFDVIIDLRDRSRTFAQWFGIELTATERNAIYIPEGFAHGYLTLEDDTETTYQMSTSFRADYSAGVRWNDPIFGIKWPQKVEHISERDRSYSNYHPSTDRFSGVSRTGRP